MFRLRFNLTLRSQLEMMTVFFAGMSLAFMIGERFPRLGGQLVMITTALFYVMLIARLINVSHKGIARHEAAHVVISRLMPKHPEVLKVALERTGGVTTFDVQPGAAPDETEAYAYVVSSLAGIVADERNYGRPGPGCDTDLFTAEWMASRYLHKHPLGFDALMNQALSATRALVTEHWDDIVRVADELLECETLDRIRLDVLLGPRKTVTP
ncbi:MAG: hypothetical protein RLZZ324_1051 [Candidatus Parcubacteria bacterium]|jgi:ATP-dependent Zn protease